MTTYPGHTTTRANADLDGLWALGHTADGNATAAAAAAAAASTAAATAAAAAAAAQTAATAALLGVGFVVTNYGALGNGVHDDTAAIQAAIAAAAATLNGGGIVYLPPGTYKVTSTITLSALQGVTIMGAGPTCTVIASGAGVAFDLFRIWGCRECRFLGFSVKSTAALPLSTAFVLETKTGTTSTHQTFRDLILQGSAAGGLGKGFKCIAGSGGDANNDFHYWDNVIVNNYGAAGWSFEHSQSKAHQLTHCIFAGNFAFSQCGVATNLNAGQGGAFSMRDFAGGGNNVADFSIGDANDYIVLETGRTEESARFLDVALGNSSGASFQVSVRNCTFAVNAAHLPADKRAIRYGFRGPLILDGFSIYCGATALAMEVYINQTGVRNVVAIGCHFDSNLGDPFTGAGAGMRLANTIDRNDGNGVVALEPLMIGATPRAAGVGNSSFITGVRGVGHGGADGTAQESLKIPKNLNGSATFIGVATSVAVALDPDEPDALYTAVVTPTSSTGAPAAGSNRVKSINKATDFLTINIEVAPGGVATQTFDWMITR